MMMASEVQQGVILRGSSSSAGRWSTLRPGFTCFLSRLNYLWLVRCSSKAVALTLTALGGPTATGSRSFETKMPTKLFPISLEEGLLGLLTLVLSAVVNMG